MARAGALTLFAALAAAPCAAGAQNGRALELRVDAIAARDDHAVHAGAGAVFRLSRYARLVAAAGAGPGTDAMRARAESAVRFHTDPFRERRWAFYAAAGGGAFFGDAPEPFLLVLLGVEGERRRWWSPAVELGVSRGARVAFVYRRSRGDVR